jgi:hypothetical protein
LGGDALPSPAQSCRPAVYKKPVGISSISPEFTLFYIASARITRNNSAILLNNIIIKNY